MLPSNTTVIIQNAKIKLSDKCRDNFFRSANSGLGIDFPEPAENIHIKGIGRCILEGADKPRATGDGGKILANPCPYNDEDLLKLADWVTDEERESGIVGFWHKHDHSFGTDFGVEGESQYGDWRGIGVLFANVNNFSIENLHIKNSHGWGISLEACTDGSVKNIHFEAYMHKEIDGMENNMENQDGIDIRNGCSNIIISDITGRTGDDLIALTAIKNPHFKPGGSLRSTHVMHNDWTKRDASIHDIIIRNVAGYSSLCWTIRLLACDTEIHNVIIDGVNGVVPEGVPQSAVILLGEPDGAYGKCLPDGISNITISNILGNTQSVIEVKGYIKDSVINNVINKRPGGCIFEVERENGMINVLTGNLLADNNKIPG